MYKHVVSRKGEMGAKPLKISIYTIFKLTKNSIHPILGCSYKEDNAVKWRKPINFLGHNNYVQVDELI